MGLDEALKKARDEFRRANPQLLAARSGVEYARGEFQVPFFHRHLVVRYPDAEVEESGRSPAAEWLQLVVLHYLLTADGTPVADQWIGFRQLPGGLIYQSAFAARSIQPLAEAFGHDLEGFRSAARALGGQVLTRVGDAAFRFLAFPRLPMACLIWAGDDELPASADILFDRAAPHYLHTEDLSVVGGYLSRALIQKKLSDRSPI